MATITSAPKDYLTTITPELQHIIFGFLLTSHEPDKAFDEENSNNQATTIGCHRAKNSNGCITHKKLSPRTHPLDYLAATSKALRDEVNEWALHFLVQHRDITKYKPLKTKSKQEKRDFLRSRNGLLNWAEKHCVFCGCKSQRSAILMNGLRCCSKCDREQWPDKITKTEARMKFDLKEEQLLPSASNSPTSAKLLQKHPGLPRIRYGTYMSSNVPTTMFLRKEVEALAKLAHGDLKEHLAKKQADRDERRKKARDNKAKKDAAALAEIEKRARHECEEELWIYRHKHHSIVSYGDEAGPKTPPMMSSPVVGGGGGKKSKKHRKSLSIDSNAANEGRVITPPVPPPQPASVAPAGATSVQRASSSGMWDDLPSMFGMSEEEWAAIPAPSPKKEVTIEEKSKVEALDTSPVGLGIFGAAVAPAPQPPARIDSWWS